MVIDANVMKQNAQHRRKTSSVQKHGWHCNFCKKQFVLEKAFLKHTCREKLRFEEIKTPIGQSAYSLYCLWMKSKKLKAPTIDTFTGSKFYLSFIKLAENVIRLNIDKPKLFIDLMTLRDISPTMWHRDQCYSIYLEFCDKEADPYDLVVKSYDKLEKISVQENIAISNIFNSLGFKRVFELIRLRVLSPWLLLHSDKFKQFLSTVDENDMNLLAGVINFNFWVTHLEKHNSIRQELIPIIKELGL